MANKTLKQEYRAGKAVRLHLLTKSERAAIGRAGDKDLWMTETWGGDPSFFVAPVSLAVERARCVRRMVWIDV